jgi:hypothetical protein
MSGRSAITLKDMFSDRATRADRAEALEEYKEALTKAYLEHDNGETSWRGKGHAMVKGLGSSTVSRNQLKRLEALEKSFSEEQAAQFAADLASQRAYLTDQVSKDWTPTNPVGGTGLTPYDLYPAAMVLVPKHTPLVNSIPRDKGQGNAYKYKRIDSFTNAGIPGGAASQRIGFSSLTQTTTWGPTGNLTLARPPKISYTGSDWSVPYVELGVSDSVDWVAQFQGLGLTDLRGLSHTALLWAHKMGEERTDLFGRGTGTGYEGVVTAPSVSSVANAASGGTIPANTYFVYVTANTGWGPGVSDSLPSTVQSTTTTGSTSTITINLNAAESTGAINYDVWVGTITGIANAHLQGTFVPTNSGGVPQIVLTSYNSTSALASGVDTSAVATDYDGYLSVQSDPAKSGYVARINGKFSTTNPGSEYDTALQQMYVNNGADPDEIWMTGALRAEFGQLMRIGGTNGAASGYRTNVVTGDGSVTMGTSVTGYVNQNTGKVLDLGTHRFMPTGASLIRSLSVPIPDSDIPAPVQKRCVQEYMAVDWPTIQMTYDTSTYQICTLAHHTPAWHGVLLGIN